jgi:hypothetical protein
MAGFTDYDFNTQRLLLLQHVSVQPVAALGDHATAALHCWFDDLPEA